MHLFTRTQILVAPSVEPVTLEETRAHLRVTHNEEDGVIDGLITAARVTVEMITRRSLITQTIKLTIDEFPSSYTIRLPHTPVRSVSHIKYYDETGNLQTLSASKYWVDTVSAPARITLKEGESYPDTQKGRLNSVEITYIAGYGDTAADVPAPVKHAIKLLVSHLYENPDIVSAGQLFGVPMSCDYLLAPYRVLTFF
ncbi:Phage conserved hypothetical protein [uncultured Caudovirales phage]|uniref:Gp6 domain containing protein n=1 Tax=uncultured Caudovirales phage TaxID=2100421 RepID=A0A6J5SZJ5_9CAUD|nr:Phage conserved hypothetical protein [uncultured Caudovirales phage]